MARASCSGPKAAHLRVMQLVPNEVIPLSGRWKRLLQPRRVGGSRWRYPPVGLDPEIGASTADAAVEAVGHFWQMRLPVVLALKWNSFSPI